jgi:hypothetical protein
MEETPAPVIAKSTAVSCDEHSRLCDEAISGLETTANGVGDRFASASAPARDDTDCCHS